MSIVRYANRLLARRRGLKTFYVQIRGEIDRTYEVYALDEASARSADLRGIDHLVGLGLSGAQQVLSCLELPEGE